MTPESADKAYRESKLAYLNGQLSETDFRILSGKYGWETPQALAKRQAMKPAKREAPLVVPLPPVLTPEMLAYVKQQVAGQKAAAPTLPARKKCGCGYANRTKANFCARCGKAF